MEIKKIKSLILEHDRLIKTINVINKAVDRNNWVCVQTPSDSSYLSDIQIRTILDLSNARIKEIEKTLEK